MSVSDSSNLPKATSVKGEVSSRIRAVDRVYHGLRDMAIRFEIKPGQRLTEVEIAERWGVSRTPVREALNRLVKEGFVVAEGGGFAVRPLDPRECYDLYELRLALESAAARLASERATDAELAALVKFVQRSMRAPHTAADTIVDLDEQFHERLAALSRNGQLLDSLRSLNARIRFVRLIDLKHKPRSRSLGEHIAIVRSVQDRHPADAIKALEDHISRRMEDIVDIIRQGIASIYVADFDRNTSVI